MTGTRRIAVGRLRLSPEAALVVLATVVFIALSVYWLLHDQRLPGGGDPGRHLSTTLAYGELLSNLDFGGLVTFNGDGGFFYPPLVRWIGALPAALGLTVQDWGTILVNLVFVPLLAAGCYLTGRLVYGRFAGMLAAIFALGTPMVLSLFHVFILDAPLAASVAITLWALLASDRFDNRRMTIAAGALAGVALMVKTTAPIFLLGPVLVMLAGGGWRQWRNIGLGLAAALVVALPWHLFHLGDISNISGQAPGGVAAGIGGGDAVTSDFIDKLAAYFWNAVNLQYFVPLFILFAVGLVFAIRELRTRRHIPELLAGLAVSYLIFALAISLRDPRYTLPLVVFVAVIATGWIATVKSTEVRGAAVGLLLAAVLLNVYAAVDSGLPATKLRLPGAGPNVGNPIQPGYLTFYDDAGYVVGPPQPDPFWARLLDAAEHEGVRTAEIRIREAPKAGTDYVGFYVLAQQQGIYETSLDEDAGEPDLLIDTWDFTPDEYWVLEKGLPVPCAEIPDGSTAPEGSEPGRLSVAVQRLEGDRYERWCDFLDEP